jgi:hypothetical protein
LRFYEFEGASYPSITTIIKLISVNDALMQWANYMGFKRRDIKTVQEETASFGTLIHSHLQSIVDPRIEKPELPKDSIIRYDLEKTINHFNAFIKDVEYETLYTELPMVSKDLGYGGTADWVVKINDKIYLMDFKTSKMPRATMYLQLGGYYNLFKEIGIELDIGAIINVNINGCAFHPINKITLEKRAKQFNMLFNFYKEWNETLEIDNGIKNKLLIDKDKRKDVTVDASV